MKKRNKIVLVGLAVLALLVLLVVLAPGILSLGPVRSAVLAKVNTSLDGSLSVGSWSMAWLRGLRIDDLEFRGARDATVVRARSVRTTRGLTSLLGSTKDVGSVEVDSPDLAILLAAGGQAEQPRLLTPGPPGVSGGAPPAPAPASAPRRLPFDVKGKLVVKSGRIAVRSTADGEAFVIRDMDLRMNCDGIDNPIAFDLSAGQAGTEGKLRCEGSMTVARDRMLDPDNLAGGTVVEVSNWDLTALSRILPPAAELRVAAGRLDTDLAVNLNGLSDIGVAGQVHAAGLRLAGAALGGDEPQADDIRLDLDVSRRRGAITFKRCSLSSPFGTATIEGALHPGGSGKQAHPEGTLSGTASIDLPALFAAFPATLSLQQGLEVLSGSVALDARAEGGAEGISVAGRIETRDLAARQGGRTIRLDTPVKLTVEGGTGKGGPRLDTLVVESSFVAASAHGDAGGLRVEASVDLASAMAEAGKFFELGDLSASGRLKLNGDVSWEDGTVMLRGLDARANQLEIGKAGMRWSEPEITLSGQAFADTQRRSAGVDGLAFRCAAGHVEARRLRIADWAQAPAGLTGSLSATLDAARCLAYYAAIVPAADGWEAAGDLKIELDIEATAGNGGSVLTMPADSQVTTNLLLNGEVMNAFVARAHPVLRNCSVTSGAADLKMNHFRMPLDGDRLNRMGFNAELAVRNLQLATTGRLLREILQAVKTDPDNVVIPDQNISVACRDGRLHPSPLTITADGHPVTLSGWVGLDDTMEYRAQTPVTEKMAGKDLYKYVKDARITLVIDGPASRPRVSRDSVRETLGGLLKEARKSFVREQGGKLLDRLRE